MKIHLAFRHLFDEFQVLSPVRHAAIKGRMKSLHYHMFVVENYLLCEVFKKIKERLLTDGRDQNPTFYPNKSFPTIAIRSIFMQMGQLLLYMQCGIVTN